MYCPEYNRLRQRYEAAIRFWGHAVLSPDARETAEIKQEAYRERDAAKRRLSDHKSTCPACKPKLKVTRRSIN
jgi:hypothetical protein